MELVERISEFVARGTITLELRLPSERGGSPRAGCIGMEPFVTFITRDGFTCVIGTVPTRALEVFAPFLAEPLSDSVEKALPASTE